MDWLLIFALAKAPIESLEYRAFATEQQCINQGVAAIADTKQRLSEDAWASFTCINIRDIVEGRAP